MSSPDEQDTVPRFRMPEIMFPTPRPALDRYLPATPDEPYPPVAMKRGAIPTAPPEDPVQPAPE